MNKMKSETIRTFMKKDFQFVGLQNTLTDAIGKLSESGADNIIVVDKNQPIGMLTARDILRARNRANFTGIVVKDVMRSRMIALPPSSHVGLASKAMEELGLDIIPIVEKGKLKGVFTMKNLMKSYLEHNSFDIIEDIGYVHIDLNVITKHLLDFRNKLGNNESLSNNEVCDLLAFQDSLAGYNKFKISSVEKRLDMSYTILANHLALKYGYKGSDLSELADYLAMNASLKNIPEYDNDFVAYTRIFDKAIGKLTKDDFNIDLRSVLSQ